MQDTSDKCLWLAVDAATGYIYATASDIIHSTPFQLQYDKNNDQYAIFCTTNWCYVGAEGQILSATAPSPSIYFKPIQLDQSDVYNNKFEWALPDLSAMWSLDSEGPLLLSSRGASLFNMQLNLLGSM